MQNRRSSNHTKRQQIDPSVLPHNKDAEKALLGSLIIDNDAFFDLSNISSDMFFYKVNQQIFESISSLSLSGSAVDHITIKQDLESRGIEDFGDETRNAEAYLAHLISLPTTSLYATDYAEIVRQLAIRRSIILAANKMATAAYSGEDFQQVVDDAQSGFIQAIEMGTERKARQIGVGAEKYVADFQDRIINKENVPALKTGFYSIDKMLNGVEPHELAIIAARPGMGKTALMLAIADNLSIKRFNTKTGVIFSLEMSEQELINRLVSRQTKIDAQKLLSGDLTDDQQVKVYEHAGLIKRCPLFVNDAPGLSVSQMLAECTRIKMVHGLDYVMVDFLQLAESHSRLQTYEKISKIARDLKNMAKNLQVPVFCLSQLSRSVEGRQDKRPILSDLRDSGQIEEAADIVILLYRADYYDPGLVPNIVEANIAKHRGGKTGTTELYFDGPTITMHNLAKIDPATGKEISQYG